MVFKMQLSQELYCVNAMASSYIHPPLATATGFTAMMAGCGPGLSVDAAIKRHSSKTSRPDLNMNAYRMHSYKLTHFKEHQMRAVSCMSGHVRTMDTTHVQIGHVVHQTWAPACS